MFKAVILGTAHAHVHELGHCAQAMADVQLLGVWDPDPSRRTDSAGKLETPAIDSLEAALGADPDVVFMGAVPGERAGLAQRALASGAGVIVDKPLALTHEALDGLIETQRRHQRPVMVFYTYRSDARVLAARTAVAEGRIGRLVRIFSAGPHKLNAAGRPAWHWTRAENGGALIDIGSHHIDVCCWFADAAPNWLCAMHANFTQPDHPEFQDFAQVQMRFSDGTMGHVEVDWLNPASMRKFGDTRMWLLGTGGKIELRLGDDVSARIWTHDQADQPLEAYDGPAGMAWNEKLIRDVAAGRPTDISQEEIWRTSRLTLHAFDSAEAGAKPLDLPAE